MRNKKGYSLYELIVVVFVLFILIPGGIGWVKNLIKLTKCDFEPSYKAEIIHGVGVFVVPVGAVTGWIDFGN